jgi:hypothetical protein
MNNLSALAEHSVELAEPGVERSKLRFLPPECELEFAILSEGWKRSIIEGKSIKMLAPREKTKDY